MIEQLKDWDFSGGVGSIRFSGAGWDGAIYLRLTLWSSAAEHRLLQKGPKSFLSQQITNNGLRL